MKPVVKQEVKVKSGLRVDEFDSSWRAAKPIRKAFVNIAKRKLLNAIEESEDPKRWEGDFAVWQAQNRGYRRAYREMLEFLQEAKERGQSIDEEGQDSQSAEVVLDENPKDGTIA